MYMENNIGVVVATYNGEHYILEQLKSIIAQSIKPDLIIISDGGSFDNTINLCDSYLSKQKVQYRILKSKTKLGVKDNFEKGLINCDSNYIFFCDQDDYWLPNKIKNAIDLFENKNACVVFCNAYITDDKLNPTGNTLWNSIGYHPLNKINIYEKNDIEFHNELLKHNVMTGMCMAIDSKIKNILIPFSNNAIHDVWIAHCSICEGNVISLNSADVLYRQHGNNVVGTTKNLRKSYLKRNDYFDKIKKRALFLEDIINRIDLDSNIKSIYFEYLSFMNNRIKYIEKKQNILYIISEKKYYKKYFYN